MKVDERSMTSRSADTSPKKDSRRNTMIGQYGVLSKNRSFVVAPRTMASCSLLCVTVVVLLCLFNSSISAATTRTYYIAADEVIWDYAPMGTAGMSGVPMENFTYTPAAAAATTTGMQMRKRQMNNMAMMNMNVSADLYIMASNVTIGSKYKKALYREYTDATFSTLKDRSAEWMHLGMLGPLIRAEVGDTIRVVFKNNASQPYSMHPHGVFYTRPNEGVPLGDTTGMDGNLVPPGMTYTYEWQVPTRAGPASEDLSSVLWMYHSHVDEVADTNAGLIGPIVITRAGASISMDDLRPRDVSREYIVSFTILDEGASHYLSESMQMFMQPPPMTEADMDMVMMDESFMQGNMKHSINGYIYANLMGLNMVIGERVRWYVFGLGSETDLHGVHWHGQTLVQSGHRVDVTEIIPASLKTLDMEPDNPGFWMLHCHTNHHIEAGMMSFFNVITCNGTNCPSIPAYLSSAAAQLSISYALLSFGMLIALMLQMI